MESVGSGVLSMCVLGDLVTISSTATVAVSVLGSIVFVSSAVCRWFGTCAGYLKQKQVLVVGLEVVSRMQIGDAGWGAPRMLALLRFRMRNLGVCGRGSVTAARPRQMHAQ
jgi:hypothetical protein